MDVDPRANTPGLSIAAEISAIAAIAATIAEVSTFLLVVNDDSRRGLVGGTVLETEQLNDSFYRLLGKFGRF